MSNLHIRSGDDYTNVRRLTITVTDIDGTPIDISGIDLTFMVKAQKADADVDALFTKTTPTDIEIASPQAGATLGKAFLSIPGTDTDVLDGRYRWELEGDDAAGNITLADGVLFVEHDLITA